MNNERKKPRVLKSISVDHKRTKLKKKIKSIHECCLIITNLACVKCKEWMEKK
jgi:hypothetical protein